MRWSRTNQSRPSDQTAPELSTPTPPLEKLDRDSEHNHEDNSPKYLDRKTVLPVVAALCLAIFLTALVYLLSRSILMHI